MAYFAAQRKTDFASGGFGTCRRLEPLAEPLISVKGATSRSINALAVGVSFGLLEISVPRPALIIALMALVMTFAGMKLGYRAGVRLGKWAEVIGGFVLIGIGARILVEHLTG